MHIPSGLTFAILGSIHSLRQTVPGYELYTGCTEVCFESSIATASCIYTTEVAYIACLCNDGTSQAGFARCVYTDCGSEALNNAAAIHMHNCQVNGSPSVLSEQQFIANGEAAGTGVTSASVSIVVTTTAIAVVSASSPTQGSTSPTTTSASPNTQPTPTQANLSTPTSTTGGSNAGNSGSGNSSLSTAALIGTIIASLTGAVGSCIGVWFGWKTYKNNKAKKDEERSLVGNRVVGEVELEQVKWHRETGPQD